MTATKKDPVIVVLQLTGGNDYYNTVIPYNDPLYMDNRPAVGYALEECIKIDDQLAFNPHMGPVKELYDQGKVAVLNGIGYANSPRSHFRSMDIWHTCEPDKVGTEGWAGRVTRELDPNKENVLTAINFGHGLPRALALAGVPVAAIADLSNYGVLTGITDQAQRARALDLFAKMYAPAVGTGTITDYLRSTGNGGDDWGRHRQSSAGDLPLRGRIPKLANRQPPQRHRPRCTWQTWGPGFSTPSTRASTPTPDRRWGIPSCGKTFPRAFPPSLTTCTPTTAATT